MWNKSKFSFVLFIDQNVAFLSILDNITNGTSNTRLNPPPSVKDIIGLSLPHIGAYKKLDNEKQVVALIDDVRCHSFLLSKHNSNSTVYHTGSVYQLWKMLYGMQRFRISSHFL